MIKAIFFWHQLFKKSVKNSLKFFMMILLNNDWNLEMSVEVSGTCGNLLIFPKISILHIKFVQF